MSANIGVGRGRGLRARAEKPGELVPSEVPQDQQLKLEDGKGASARQTEEVAPEKRAVGYGRGVGRGIPAAFVTGTANTVQQSAAAVAAVDNAQEVGHLLDEGAQGERRTVARGQGIRRGGPVVQASTSTSTAQQLSAPESTPQNVEEGELSQHDRAGPSAGERRTVRFEEGVRTRTYDVAAPAAVPPLPEHTGAVADMMPARNILNASNIFKLPAPAAAIPKGKVQMLLQGGLQAIKAELENPTMQPPQPEYTFRPAVLNLVRTILADTQDARTKQDGVNMLQMGAWRDLRTIATQYADFFRHLTQETSHEWETVLAMEQPDLPHNLPVYSDEQSFGRLKKLQYQLYCMVLDRKFPTTQMTSSGWGMISSVRLFSRIVNEMGDLVGEVPNVPVLMPWVEDVRSFQQRATSKMVPLEPVTMPAGQSIRRRFDAARMVPTTQQERAMAARVQQVAEAQRQLAQGIMTLRHDFPYYWRLFYGFLELSEQLSIHFGVPRYVAQGQEQPYVRAYHADTNAPRPTFEAHIYFKHEVLCLGMAIEAREEQIRILTANGMPITSNLATYAQEIHTILQELDEEQKNRPDMKDKVDRARDLLQHATVIHTIKGEEKDAPGCSTDT